jgi:hypothetical protein
MNGALPDLRAHAEKIARAILGSPNRRLSTRTQLRFGNNGSVAVEIAGEKRGQWFDHEAGVGGGLWELLTVKGHMTNGAAIAWLRSEIRIDIQRAAQTSREIVAVYDYRDEAGVVLFQVCRFEPKDFRQRRPDGMGAWTWGVRGVRRVPYRLPELIAAPVESIVFVVEGEKDADRLANLELVATCNAGGVGKWRAEFARFFVGRDVIILTDNDDAGRDHARAVATNLAPVSTRVRMLELPGVAPKGDVSDWLHAGGSRDELQRLVKLAPAFPPERSTDESPDTDDGLGYEAEIARLAGLPRIEYGRQRKTAAKRLGCPVSILDRAVNAERSTGNAARAQGRALDLPKPDPWPETVDGAALLDGIAEAIRLYVVLDPCEADAVALWVLGVHAFDAWVIFPRLFVTAPEKGCGKSTLLDVLSRLVPKPLGASSITPAALFRVIEAARPTLLLDEADAYARDNEQLRAVLDAGHRRDGAVIRTVGENHEPRQFSAWAPVALAAIGHLPGTVEDRSLIIRLRRRRPDEPILSFRIDRAGELEVLAAKAARWALDNAEKLAAADPVMSGLYNRRADNWRPLIAVADLAGGKWSDCARGAVAERSDEDEDSESARVLLLGDLRALFEREASGVLFTKEILAALCRDENRPWTEWNNGKPITGSQLAKLLRPFRVRPKSVRRGPETDKGYRRGWFDDVFARYLPASQSVTASQPSEAAAFSRHKLRQV